MNGGLALFDALLVAGEIAEARAWLNDAIAAAENAADGAREAAGVPVAVLLRARIALYARSDAPADWAQALADGARLADPTPDDLHLHVRVLWAHAGAGPALAAADAVLWRDGALAPGFSRLGELMVSIALAAAEARAHDRDALLARALTAADAFVQAANGGPGAFLWAVRRGSLLEALERPADALVAYRAALAIPPGADPLYASMALAVQINIARLLIVLGENDAAGA